MSSRTCELTINGMRVSQAPSESDVSASTTQLQHPAAAAAAQGRCCPFCSRETLCRRSCVFSPCLALILIQSPLEQGEGICSRTSNCTHLGERFGIQIIQLYSDLYRPQFSPRFFNRQVEILLLGSQHIKFALLFQHCNREQQLDQIFHSSLKRSRKHETAKA